MENKLGILGGGILLAFGLFMFKIAGEVYFTEGSSIGAFFLFLYGAIPIILGFYLLSNLKNEDEIEQIKQTKTKRGLNK
jgi:hypothetical protein